MFCIVQFKVRVKSMLVDLFIAIPSATVSLCIYILPGFLCQGMLLNMTKLILSIQSMLRKSNTKYPLRHCKFYDLQVGNKYNLRKILQVNELLHTKIWIKIISVLYIFKIWFPCSPKKKLLFFIINNIKSEQENRHCLF